MISKECPRLLSIKLASDLWVVYCTVKWSDNVCQPVKCDIYYWIYPLEIGFASALFTSYQTGTYIWLSRDYERRHYIKLYKALVSRQLKPWKASCGPVTEVAHQWGVTFISSWQFIWFKGKKIGRELLVQVIQKMVAQNEERIARFFAPFKC